MSVEGERAAQTAQSGARSASGRRALSSSLPASSTDSAAGTSSRKFPTVDVESMRALTLQRIARTKKEASRKLAASACLVSSARKKRDSVALSRRESAAAKARRRSEVYAVNAVMKSAFDGNFKDFCEERASGGGGDFVGVGAV